MRYEDLEGNLLKQIEAELQKRGISSHKPEDIQLKKRGPIIEINYKGILKFTLIWNPPRLVNRYRP